MVITANPSRGLNQDLKTLALFINLYCRHKHADALRVSAKEILKDLWLESRRIHEEWGNRGDRVE